VQAWRGGAEAELGGPLQRALLAYLLLHVGEVVSRERLIDALWDDDPPPRATRSLETKISRLRAALNGDATVVARGGGYVLEVPAEEIDVHRFGQALAQGTELLAGDPRAARARLEAALALWRGPALAGLTERLLSVERDRLEEQRLQALEARIDADLALGGGLALVAELEAMRAQHPLRERFTEQLMLALYRSGRQADALEAYRATHRALRDELGLTPGPRLRALEQAILRHDESLGPPPIGRRIVRRAGGRRAVAAGAVAGLALLAVILPLVVASGDERPHSRIQRPGLILLDSASGEVRAHVPVGASQGISRFGYGFLWTVGEDGVMSQVDPRAGRLVRSIPVGVQAADVAVGAGGIWITDANGPTLLRIDPLTGQINRRARLSMRGLRHPGPNGGIAIDGGSLWIARGPDATDRLDSSTLRLQDRIVVRQSGCGLSSAAQCILAAGGGRVWVVGGDRGTLTGIDEATDRVVVRTATLRPYLCCVAVGGGSVWVAEAHDIAQLSHDGRLIRRYGVGSANIGNISYDGGYLWATADTAGRLLRIAARDGRVRTTRLGNLLIGTAASRGIVAAAAIPLPAGATRALGRRVLRIGLLQDWLNHTDPAIARHPAGTGRWQWQLHDATCAGLFRHPDAGGSAGEALVPELAAGPPHRSPDRRTWTIPIRAGLRFSPPLGRPVTVRDVRATLNRALSPQLGPAAPAARILRDVAGLGAYRRGSTADVSGITVRDGALVVRTRRPVADLASRLASPYFCVLPEGAPAPPGGYQEPLPTAGPYYLAEHVGGVEAVLRRNPNYRGTRPQRLDAVVFRMNVDERAGPAAVRRGGLDVFAGRRTTVGSRVGCRVVRPQVPGLDLAELCLVR
jgi:DNA-binding SARP family transcriptional activator/streptogramin lyase